MKGWIFIMDDKRLEMDALENVAGGTTQETKEEIWFMDRHFPDVRVGNSKELRKFLNSIGISKVSSASDRPNIYYDMDGNTLTHEQFMRILKDAAGVE